MAKIKDTPKVLRPREKFLQKGPDALSKSDLLAIVLGSGIKGKNVQELAQQIELPEKPTYIDLFCGAGGFSLGFNKAGFENIFSVDIEKNFCKTYKANFRNHNLIEKDISKLTDCEIKQLTDNKKVAVIIGGPLVKDSVLLGI